MSGQPLLSRSTKPTPQLTKRVSTPVRNAALRRRKAPLPLLAYRAGVSSRKWVFTISRLPSRLKSPTADTHAGLLHAVFAEGNAALHALLGKGPVVVVVEEKARRGVASHVDVRPAVIVEIGRRHRQPEASVHLTDPGRDGDISERPVALVVIQRMPPVRQPARTAVHRDAQVVASAESGSGVESSSGRTAGSWKRKDPAAVAIVVHEGAPRPESRPARRAGRIRGSHL